jgi:hypothetical protein
MESNLTRGATISIKNGILKWNTYEDIMETTVGLKLSSLFWLDPLFNRAQLKVWMNAQLSAQWIYRPVQYEYECQIYQ